MKLHQRRQLVLAALLWPATRLWAQGNAVPPEVAAALTGARMQGKGTLRFVGLKIYDGRLWAGTQAVGEDPAGVPFALELQYARGFKGAQITERSLEEMRRSSSFDTATGQRWQERMTQLFPDVKEGDRVTCINLPGTGARFFLNGAARGDVNEPAFASSFFGIWLSPRTSEPALREALLGRAKP